MLDKIILLSIKNRLLVVVLAILLIISGGYVVSNIPIDVFPDLTSPTVTIMTDAHGMATEEVESLVTFPIETSVNGATGVRRVRSSSAMGISIIYVEFDWGTDIFLARQIVTEKLQLVASQIPAGVDQPVLAPISSIMGEIMLISLSSEKHSPLDVRTAADWEIRKRLLAVNGVSQVIPIGGGKKQYQVLVDPNKLIAFDLSLHDMHEALEKVNLPASGGIFMEKGHEYTIRGLGRIYSVEDIENSVVANNNGIPILVKDLAVVKIAAGTKYGNASVNGQEAVVMAIQRQPNANTKELTERVNLTLDNIQNTLPEGMVINKHLFRQADFIDRAINNVQSAIRDGAILVIIILFLFLGNIRTTFISLTAIPLSLIAAIYVMKYFEININTMTLGGMAIAIGALVDDAIIDVENVFRRLRENHAKPVEEQKEASLVIFEASREIRSSIVNATLIIIVVFLPLFFLSGVEGRLLQPLGVAYIASIGASLLVALTVTPALCYYLLPKSKFIKEEGDSRVVDYLKKLYSPVLDHVIKFPKRVLFTAFGLILLAVLATPFLGREFLPQFNEGALNVTIITVPGTSLKESDKIGLQAERIMLGYSEILSTARRTGRDELDEHSFGVNQTEIEARYELDENTKAEFLESLRKDLSVLPGTNVIIGQPLSHRIDHMLSGTKANIAIKIFGEELYRLRNIGQQIKNVVSEIDGLVDISLEQQIDVPQIRIIPNRIAMAKYGMTVAGLSEAIDVAFQGEVISQILEKQKTFDLVLRFDEKARGSIDKIKTTIFKTPSGYNVSLIEMAHIVSEKGPNKVSRENVQRKIVVSANVAGRDLGSAISEIKNRIASDVDIPASYYVQYGGQFESEQKASRIITLLSILAIFVIYLLLHLEFRSLKTSLLVMFNLPLAMVGGVIAVFVTDGIVSIASMVGFITLFGIATRNGILMVSHYQHLLAEGKSMFEAVKHGSLERLSPVLMTALATMLALIPLVIAGNQPGNEIQSPMATVIMGGLLSSTILILFVMPALYVLFMKKEG